MFPVRSAAIDKAYPVECNTGMELHSSFQWCIIRLGVDQRIARGNGIAGRRAQE
jgi:hypothetical protein